MAKKKGSIVERHIEKIVFGVVGLICLALLWVFVIGNPNSAELRGKKIGPGKIDAVIARDAELVKSKSEDPAVNRIYNDDKAADYSKLLSSSVGEISGGSAVFWVNTSDKLSVSDEIYDLPDIGAVTGVYAEAVRGAVFYPAEQVEMDRDYGDVETEIADMDFVTVEGQLNIGQLYADFSESFGSNVKYAIPVIASVELSRRAFDGYGNWGQWDVVPRAQIDRLKILLGALPAKASALEFPVTVTIGNYEDFEMFRGIIQPGAYDIASSNARWFPPSLHKEFSQMVDAERAKIRREERQEEREQTRDKEKERSSESRRTITRRTTTPRRPRTTDSSGSDVEAQKIERLKEEARLAGAKNVVSLASIERDFSRLQLNKKARYSENSESITLWAHDDTVEPGNSYQYRIRLGVFNPVAGKNRVAGDKKDLTDDVVLWSAYSEISETVEIEEMVHFFPVDSDSDGDKSADIVVGKYYMGGWQMEEFTVYPGQTIGEVVTLLGSEDDEDDSYSGAIGEADKEVTEVDYSTSVTLVDVVSVNDWAGSRKLTQREYDQIFYTRDGVHIEQMAVRSKEWPDELKDTYEMIDQASEEEVIISDIRPSSGYGSGNSGYSPSSGYGSGSSGYNPSSGSDGYPDK